MSKTHCRGTVSLYCFYNWNVGKCGEPFGLCDVHFLKQPQPEGCYMKKLADNSLIPCAEAEEESNG